MEKKVKRNIDKRAIGNPYPVEAGHVMERMADYETGEKLQKKFESVLPENHFSCNGNIGCNFVVSRKTLKTKVTEDAFAHRDKDTYMLYEVMSSALMLYRLICMFPNPKIICEGYNGYKVPWEMFFKHVETGKIICMSEWKGSFSLRTEFNDITEVPVSLQKDLCMLFDLLYSNNSPHPYDHTVAGSCA